MTQESSEPSGLKGWLWVVGLGLILSPFRSLQEMRAAYIPMFNDGTWDALTDPTSVDYTPYFAGAAIIEMSVDILFLILSLWLALLFFTRSPLFPKVFIGALLASPLALIFCYWLTTWPFPEDRVFSEENLASVLLSCLPCIVWMPYMLLSKRVHNTFVADGPDEEEEMEEEQEEEA